MDFAVSDKMQTILDMVNGFMDHEVIPLEGEFLHGDPETLEDRIFATQKRSSRWNCGPRTTRLNSGGWACRWSNMDC